MPNKTKILVIEDEEMLSTMYKVKFENEGYDVTVANDGADGIEKAIKEKPDMILLDIIMPKMDGVTLADRLCALEPRIKVIFTSGYSTKERIEKNLQNEEIHFIEKPYKMSALLEKIQFVLISDLS